MFRNSLMLLSAVALTGCLAQSNVQSKYMAQQDECRGHVQSTLAVLTGPDNNLGSGQPPSGSGSAVQQFSDCMNKTGWHVSVPKPGSTTVVVNNPPSGSPSTNPHAAAAVAPAPTQTTTVYNPPAPGQTAVVSPPSGAPSTNPSAAAARVAPPVTTVEPAAPVATYQPGRPATSTVVTYGQGAGRNF